MLSCKDVANRASDYLDNQTDARLRWQIRLHLMMCSHCRRFMRHLRLTRHLVKNTVQQEKNDIDTEAIYRRVLQRIETEKKSG